MEPKVLILRSNEPANFPILNHKNPLDSFPSCFFQTRFIYHYVFRVVFFLQVSPTWGTAAKVYGMCFPLQPSLLVLIIKFPPLAQPHKNKSFGDHSVGPRRPIHLQIEVAVNSRTNNKSSMSWWSIAHKIQLFLYI